MSPLRLPARKVHKYRAKATHLNGIRFASKAEAQRYGYLKLLEKAGEVRDLELQPRFPLHAPIKGRTNVWEEIGCYVADFRYRAGPTGVLTVEDVKGMDTPLSKWKRKHVTAQYGIEVQLIRKMR